MAKKYILCPGPVQSCIDGDLHFIGAERLAKLYGVRLSECFVWDWGKGMYDRTPRGVDTEKLIWLTPRYDGAYPLFEIQLDHG